MNRIKADVAILGAGFGGSLTALLAQRIGMKPVLIERGKHPRFAIGESSTPLADLALADLAERYDLPRLMPLTRYGSWRRAYPELTCGLKRGFSYFHHEAGQAFDPRTDRSNELLVAASADDEHSDTHWFRADFDAFLVDEVRAANIPYFDQTDLTAIQPDEPWRLSGRHGDELIDISAAFTVDATGAAGVLAATLGIANELEGVRTNSRSIYAHFEGVTPWTDVYRERGGSTRGHPYPSHAAALHHVFDGGWMYVLHFDNGITSAGFVLDNRRWPLDPRTTAQAEWDSLMSRYPSIARQFERAQPVMPLVRTGRMQRRAARMAGANWAMLPYAACFLDPLHSAGNAHNLCGIQRLIALFEADECERPGMLKEYERTTFEQVDLLDKIIHGCYLGFERFDLMTAYAMLYFAGAHSSELRRRENRCKPGEGFLNCDDRRYCELVATGYETMRTLAARSQLSAEDICAWQSQVAKAIKPYNQAGLCDPAKRNMYECV